MLVDEDVSCLSQGEAILAPKYEVLSAPSVPKMFELLEKNNPALILLAIKMSGMDGCEAAKKLKAHARFSPIPVIFLSSSPDEENTAMGLDLEVVDYFAKPLSAPRLLKRIQNHLLIADQKVKLKEQQEQLKHFNDNVQATVRKTTDQIYELQNAMLSTVAEMVEFRDTITGGHIARTQRYLSLLVTRLISRGIYMDAISSWDLNFLLPSAQLHDVGKIAISDLILNKPGKLSSEEFEIMKKHTTFGVVAIEKIESKTSKHDFLRYAKVFAGTHHEKWDGTGYPNGLKGIDIPLPGRLMAIADVYDALIAIRPYKPPLPVEKAQEIIFEGSGIHFDPQLVEVFRLVAPDFAAVAENLRDLP